jgi:hypothetical protein
MTPHQPATLSLTVVLVAFLGAAAGVAVGLAAVWLIDPTLFWGTP